MQIMREVTPLTKNDCFSIFRREKTGFNFPLHYHYHIEINLILNGTGAQRVVGNHISEIGKKELVCIGSNLPHGWFNYHNGRRTIKEVTIQFHNDLINNTLLEKKELIKIRDMFENAKRGISFSEDTIDKVGDRIIALAEKSGFESILELLSIINQLSLSEGRVLSGTSVTENNVGHINGRIEKFFLYMEENFHRGDITLADIAKETNMAEASFSRFIKQNTGKSFVENLNDFRLSHVSRMLLDTELNIAEISYKCGFNNMANFNRIFKKRKGMTPKKFRESFVGKRVFI